MNEWQRIERRQRDLALADALERNLEFWDQAVAKYVAAGGELPPDWVDHPSSRELVQLLRTPYEGETAT